MTQSTGPVGTSELLLEIRRQDGLPLHEQIERSLRDDIRSGRLRPGARLPSTRALAAELGVSRGVVTEAYGQLSAEGYLVARQGSAARVASTVRSSAPRAPARSLIPAFAYDFHPGTPDLAGFPRDRWLRSLRAAWRQAPIDAVGYPDPRGVPALRETLADYLGRARGAATDPEYTIVCTGFRQALSLLCRQLAESGVEAVALEDPGWHPLRVVVEQSGLAVVPIPVDRDGLRVDSLEGSGATVVIVTPAHQFPTGATLTSERRAALVEWAERSDGLVVEDDYDSELRYDGGRVGALQGLAPERVVLIGSASKRLVPGIRIAWMLSPSWLSWQLIAAKSVEDAGSEVVGQLALCDFIERGELDRHLRRMRLAYQRRHAALHEALASRLPEARPAGAAAGLFELVELEADVREASLIEAAAGLGVGLEGLSLHRFAAADRAGLVLGFGNLAEPAIAHGLGLTADALRRASASGP
jgi:GntR family transcriptional regulator/MocR family aminotransferase